MEYKIGDRVKILDGNGIGGLKGLIGIVRTKSGVEYGVEFDEHFMHGHNLGGRLRNYNGRYFREIHLTSAEPTLIEFIGDKFKGRKAKVIQNGIVYKLIKTDGTVLYTYIPEKEMKRVIDTKQSSEKIYIELFEQAITEFKANQEKE